MASEPAARGELLKILGLGFGVSVSIGAIIGSGILRAPSSVAQEVPVAWLIVGLWVLGGLQSALSANMYAELGAALPRSGGPYVLAKRIYGDIGGLVVGWSDYISWIAGIAAASVSFAEFLPLLIPAAAAHKIAVALALQIALYATNILGLREGSALQIATSAAKAGMLFLFILAAVFVAAPVEPPSHLTASAAWGWSSVILAYMLIFGAYAGWVTPMNFSGENHSPGRHIPRAMFLGIAVTALLYVGVNGALVHALGPHRMAATPLPFRTVIDHFGGALPSLLFALTAVITVASCANANMMAGSRVLFALAEDRLLPAPLAYVNKGGSPVLAYLLSAVISMALALTGAFALVFGLIATLGTVTAVLIEIGFFILRRREPELARPFRAVGYPWLPAFELCLDSAFLCLIALADHVGVVVAIGLALLCVPLALVARRARRTAVLTVAL